jgi:hypothetical protein
LEEGKCGKEVRKEEEPEPSMEMGTVRGTLNLQDSVENSFREKLLMQVRREEGDMDGNRGKEVRKEEKREPIKEMGIVRGSLNLQDSVEKSFRKKLVIKVRKEEGGKIRRGERV